MNIIVTGRYVFDDYLRSKNINDSNVESIQDVAFISIHNDIGDSEYEYVLNKNKSNVLVQSFSDVEEDTFVKLINKHTIVKARAFTQEQAKEMYAFIMNNMHRKSFFIHCTAGVSRSGAIGVFINELLGKSYTQFKQQNKRIQENSLVLYLLRREAFGDMLSGMSEQFKIEDSFKVEVLNPKSQKQSVALYNERNPDQHTSIEEIQWCDFELDCNHYFGVVKFEDLRLIKEYFPDLSVLFGAKKMLTTGGEYTPPRFGFSSYYGGETLGEWLKSKNLMVLFNL